MAIYDECAEIYRERMELYLLRTDVDGNRDDDHLIWQGIVKAIKTHVQKNYPETPNILCWHCKEELPYTTVEYDSGTRVEVCLVCGFNVERE